VTSQSESAARPGIASAADAPSVLRPPGAFPQKAAPGRPLGSGPTAVSATRQTGASSEPPSSDSTAAITGTLKIRRRKRRMARAAMPVVDPGK
jgi:hypothetical protein